MTTSMKKLIFTALLVSAVATTASAEGNVVYQPLYAEVPTKLSYTAEQLKNPNAKPNGEVVSAEEFEARRQPTETQKARFYSKQEMSANESVGQATVTAEPTATTEKKSSITITVGDKSKTYYKQDCEPDPNAKMGDKRVHNGMHETYFVGFGWIEYDPDAVAIGIVVDGLGDINKQVGYMG